jgi:Tfp pilus assembly protein PilW
MASALAALVEAATSAPGIAGVTRRNVPDTMRALFTDDVHLTELGAYFCALVTVAAWLKRDLPDVWRPDSVSADAAQSLRAFVNRFVGHFYGDYREADLQSAVAQIRRSFNATYWPYVRDVHYRQQMGWPAAHLKALRHRFEWSWRLRRGLP